jgi:hypothetical protein
LCRFVQGQHGLSMASLDRVAEVIGLQIVIEPRTRKKDG